MLDWWESIHSLVFLSCQIYKVKALVMKLVTQLEFNLDLVPSTGWQLFTKAQGDGCEKSHLESVALRDGSFYL